MSATDIAALDGKGQWAGKTLSVSAMAELMHNQFKGSPIGGTSDIDVVQDAAGNPVVLAIGSDQRLRAMHSTPGTDSGWQVAEFAAVGVTHFDVAQDGAGNISLTFAATSAGTPGATLYVAALLPANTDWSTVEASLRKVGGIDSGFAPSSVRVGDSDDGTAPDAIVTGMLGGQQYYYRIKLADASAARLELPQNVTDPKAILGIASGFAFGQRGTFFLYQIGDSQTLTCITEASADEGSLTYDYSPGNPAIPAQFGKLRYNCIATATGSKSDPFSICSDIYVGTDQGVFVFRNADAGALQQVGAMADVHEITVAQDDQRSAVWAACAGDHLYYGSAPRGGAAWNLPVLFASDVLRIAPMRNRRRRANEVFAVRSDLTLEHRWQDPATTLWHARTLSMPGKPFMFDLETYTAHIHLEDDQAQALFQQTVSITSSEWTYATINGAVYSLDRDAPAEVQTDMQGNITIVQLTQDISAPVFHLQSAAFAETINIYPNGKVRKGLAAVRSADDLRNARTADNKPVLADGLSDDVVSGTAQNVATISDAGATLVGGQPLANGVLNVTPAGQRQMGQLALANLPHFAVGFTLKAGAWQPMTPDRAALGALDFSLDSVLGDILHFLDSAFEAGLKAIEKGVTVLADGTSFVLQHLEDGLSLVLTLAGKVVKLALTTLAAAFKALNWILKLIGIDLAKILAWLGHLLGWDDIWDTHKILASVMRNAVDYAVNCAQTEVESWRGALHTQLSGVGDRLKKLVLPEALATLKPKAAYSAPTMGAAQNTPQVNFSSYHMQHSGWLDGGAPAVGTGLAAGAVDDFKDFLDKIVVPALGREFDDVTRLAQDLYKLVSDPQSALPAIVSILADLVDLIVDPVAAVADGLLALLSKILEGVRSGLCDKIDIPFLGAFYEFVTDLLGEEEDFTVCNAVALLAAIPMVEGMKLMGMGTPIKDHGDELTNPALFSSLLPGGHFTPTQTGVLAARASLGAAAPTSAIDYQHTGRFGGSVLGLLNIVANFVAANDGSSAAGFEGSLSGWMSSLSVSQKIAVGLALARSAMTVPVARNSQGNVPVFKVCAFGVSALAGTTVFMFPKEFRGGYVMTTNGACLVLAILEDALGPTPDAMTIAADVIGNGGGFIRGMGMQGSNAYLTGGGAILGAVGAVLTLVSATRAETVLENTVQNLGG
jgi:hypothetical protein